MATCESCRQTRPLVTFVTACSCVATCESCRQTRPLVTVVTACSCAWCAAGVPCASATFHVCGDCAGRVKRSRRYRASLELEEAIAEYRKRIR